MIFGTETMDSARKIMISESDRIVSEPAPVLSVEVHDLRPERIVSGLETIVAAPQTIDSASKSIVSVPKSVLSERELMVSARELIDSKRETAISEPQSMISYVFPTKEIEQSTARGEPPPVPLWPGTINCQRAIQGELHEAGSG